MKDSIMLLGPKSLFREFILPFLFISNQRYILTKRRKGMLTGRFPSI